MNRMFERICALSAGADNWERDLGDGLHVLLSDGLAIFQDNGKNVFRCTASGGGGREGYYGRIMDRLTEVV